MKHKLQISSLILLLVLLSFGAYAETTVYTTRTGKKYHSTQYCTGLNNAKEIYTETETSAINKGLTKCDLCWTPSEENTQQPQQTNPEVTRTTTTVTTTKAAPKKTKLYTKIASLKKGSKLKVKLLNNSKNVKWTISNKRGKIVKKTNKYAIVKGLKKGSVFLKATIGKKIYKIKLKVK